MASKGSAPEFYVQIPAAQLQQLRIHHLTSAIDPSIALPDNLTHGGDEVISGYTEWVGTWNGARISLGWDWACVRGEIIPLDPSEIRTNIRLLAADGTAHSPILTRMYLSAWLETLPWRDEAIRDLVRGNEPDNS
jgi:Domain of unknown function (DUF4902)